MKNGRKKEMLIIRYEPDLMKQLQRLCLVDVVLDTDAYNETDDLFVIAHLLNLPEKGTYG